MGWKCSTKCTMLKDRDYDVYSSFVTRIRGGGETCRSIVGYDTNALYLWAIMQDATDDDAMIQRGE